MIMVYHSVYLKTPGSEGGSTNPRVLFQSSEGEKRKAQGVAPKRRAVYIHTLAPINPRDKVKIRRQSKVVSQGPDLIKPHILSPRFSELYKKTLTQQKAIWDLLVRRFLDQT